MLGTFKHSSKIHPPVRLKQMRNGLNTLSQNQNVSHIELKFYFPYINLLFLHFLHIFYIFEKINLILLFKKPLFFKDIILNFFNFFN